jgi:hypothetical protein
MIRKMIVVIIAVLMAMVATPAEAGSLSTQDLGALLSPTDLVYRLLGQGVTVSNISFKGVNHAAGTFSGGTGIIGFEDGIVLSSGKIASIIGPNNSPSISTSNNMPGDPDVAALIPGYLAYDATVLEFDFVPAGNKIIFEYVFGSEEYIEWVGSAFNDAFGFFINGINQALIPGTSTPVSINSVNHVSNTGHFINNTTALINTQMDGLTTVLTVTADVIPNETNHIKLVIADAGDFILDSWVMLRAESFVSIPDLNLESLPTANVIGTVHHVTATATLDGVPQMNVPVAFDILEGPNTGKSGIKYTDVAGIATWSYIGNGGVGTDTIQASAMIGGLEKISNDVYKVWESPPNQPPVANAGPDLTVEANTADGALVDLNGSFSTDDGNLKPLTYAWTWTKNIGTQNTEAQEETQTATGEFPTVKLPLGESLITLTVHDGEHSASDTTLITVVDTTPPKLFIDCVEGTNPHGENIPGAKGNSGSKANKGGEGKNSKGKEDNKLEIQNPDGFYKVTVATIDENDADADVFVGTMGDPLFFAIEPGTMVIKFTKAPGSVPQIKSMGSKSPNGRAIAVEHHITLPDDLVFTTVDSSGNSISSKTCIVPPYGYSEKKVEKGKGNKWGGKDAPPGLAKKDKTTPGSSNGNKGGSGSPSGP